jgi:hypothetical protein
VSGELGRTRAVLLPSFIGAARFPFVFIQATHLVAVEVSHERFSSGWQFEVRFITVMVENSTRY